MAYTVQPGATAVMDPKNAKGLTRDVSGNREWSFGLFGCCGEPGTCLLSWFCPCMTYAQVKSRLTSLNTEGRPHPTGGEMINSDCMVHGCLTGCLGAGWVLQIGQRGETRQRYRINGGGVGDCLSAACCAPCELTQQSQEIALEEQALMGQVHEQHQKA